MDDGLASEQQELTIPWNVCSHWDDILRKALLLVEVGFLEEFSFSLTYIPPCDDFLYKN